MRLVSSLIVRPREFEVVVNDKTPIESSQMDTAGNEGAFYKQADVRNDPVKCGGGAERPALSGAQIAPRNGYLVLEQAVDSRYLKEPFPEREWARLVSRAANTGVFTRRVISIRGRKQRDP